MKRTLPILMSVGIFTLGVTESMTAAPANGSFESGSFDGWRLEMARGYSSSNHRYRAAGSATVKSSFGASPLQAAIAGSKFAIIGSLANGNFTGNRTYHISLSQELALMQGDTLTGWSSFYNGDFEAQDSAWVKILDDEGRLVTTPWRENSGCVPEQHFNTTAFNSTTPWTPWSWQAPASGSYTLSLGVTTHDDNNYASYGFFDNIFVIPATLPVPEPSAFSLVALGATALAAWRRNRRN